VEGWSTQEKIWTGGAWIVGIVLFALYWHSTIPKSSPVRIPAAAFCAHHPCIANFFNGTGYIVQCSDGMWSHSGGRPGACSDHGGER
jgi:hypothetical protein